MVTSYILADLLQSGVFRMGKRIIGDQFAVPMAGRVFSVQMIVWELPLVFPES